MLTRMLLLLFISLIPILTKKALLPDRLDRFMKREARKYERQQNRENRRILKEQHND